MTAFAAFQTFLALAVGHYLGDYALQSEYMSKAKNRTSPFGSGHWLHAMAAHCAIHGGIVWGVTGSVWLGLAEAACHALIDDSKCARRLTYGQDQFLHLACKALWVSVILSGAVQARILSFPA